MIIILYMLGRFRSKTRKEKVQHTSPKEGIEKNLISCGQIEVKSFVMKNLPTFQKFETFKQIQQNQN